MLFGDWLFSSIPNNDQTLPIRCVVDNSVHFLVGVVSWFIVILGDLSLGQIKLTPRFGFDYRLLETIGCGMIASVLDLDHFWEAGALDLKVILQKLFL